MTGFGFPFDHLLPSHKIGIVSLVVLAITGVARYPLGMVGAWRVIYVVGAPALTRLAPIRSRRLS